MAYLIMALIGIGLALYTRSEQGTRAVIARYALAGAVVMSSDWVAFGWFQLYTYRPHLVANPLMDGAIGLMMAEWFFVPALFVFMNRFLPGWRGAALGALIVTGIEYVMVRTGLFSHTGWQLWYTTLGFFVYFMVLHKFWDALRRGVVGVETGLVIVRLAILFIGLAFLTLVLFALNLVQVKMTLLPTMEGNQALGRFFVYVPVNMVLHYWVATAHHTARWWRVGATVLLLGGYELLLSAAGVRQFRPPWNAAIDLIAQVLTIPGPVWVQDLIRPSDLTDQQTRRILV